MNELHNANYFKIGFVQLPDYKVPVIIKNNFTFCPSKSRENFINIFQDLNTKFKDFQGLSRTAKKIQDFPGLFQDVATLGKSFAQYVTVWLVRIQKYKNADEKAFTFSRRSKNLTKRTKTDEKRILCKFTFS